MAKRETAHRAGKPSEIPKVDLNSADVLADRLVVLKEHFPEVFTEGKVDFDRLKNALGASLDTNGERYGLSWAGKTDCFREIQTPTSATLVPVRDQSVEFERSVWLYSDMNEAPVRLYAYRYVM